MGNGEVTQLEGGTPHGRYNTLRKSARCFKAPILTSSKSFIKPLNTGTRSSVAKSSPRITANSWMLEATMCRTFHCKHKKLHHAAFPTTFDKQVTNTAFKNINWQSHHSTTVWFVSHIPYA